MFKTREQEAAQEAVLLARLGFDGPGGDKTLAWSVTYGGFLGADPDTAYVLAADRATASERFKAEENVVVSPITAPLAYDVVLQHRVGSQTEWQAWLELPEVQQWLDENELLQAAINNVASLGRAAREQLRDAALDEAFGTEQLSLTAYGEPGADRHSLWPQLPQHARSGATTTVVSITAVGPVPLPQPKPPEVTHTTASQPLAEREADANRTVRAASFPQPQISAPTPPSAMPTSRAQTASQPTQVFGR